MDFGAQTDVLTRMDKQACFLEGLEVVPLNRPGHPSPFPRFLNGLWGADGRHFPEDLMWDLNPKASTVKRETTEDR